MTLSDRDARIAAKLTAIEGSLLECRVYHGILADLNWAVAELRASLSREEEAKKDAERMDAIEHGLFRISPDGMDGWRVRAAGTLGGMRQGYVNHGAHRLREAIDAACAVSLSENVE